LRAEVIAAASAEHLELFAFQGAGEPIFADQLLGLAQEALGLGVQRPARLLHDFA
jgi:hypothetical protein